jgi:glycosyltransferase involved in cell wall biosynthesis
MPVLINPSGRFVIVDDQTEFQNLLRTYGFKIPTPQEEKDYLEARKIRLENIIHPPEEKGDNRIFLATVSQGGKDGYSVASYRLILELKKLGILAQTHYDNQKVCVLFHNPYSIGNIESPYKIVMTMFESDKIPDDWQNYLEMADEVIVPSKWCRDVFAKAGIHAKVIPLGYDSSLFKFFQRENKAEKHKPFTFLHYNAFNIRKGFPEVFKAFVKEFDPSEPVRMIFKTTVDPIPLPITKEKYPNIEIISGKTTDGDLLDIINKSDCFVFPSRGEGFGITPLECMATGMPAIVPNAHGITEYFNPEFMYEAKVGSKCPALYSKYKNQDVGSMVVCDVDDLASKMRWVYEHQAEALEKGRKASEYVKQWTFENTAIALKKIIDVAMKKEITANTNKNKLVLELI